MKKTRLNSSKDNFTPKSFRFSTKRKLSILLNVLFPFVSFLCVLSILKCKTLFSLENTYWTCARQIRFFLRPLSGWQFDFCGGGVCLVWVTIFFPASGVRNFSPTYNGERFFFQHYTSWSLICFFFSAVYYFSQVFPCKLFSHRNRSAGYFFLKSPINPSKVKWSASKIYQTFAQLRDSDLSIISKAFWNNRGQNPLGEKGGIHFYLPLPRESLCTVTSWIAYHIFLPMVLSCARGSWAMTYF